MQGRIEKSNNPNPGVKCVVDSCYYYGSGDHCYASKIEVEPPNSSGSEETDCATFILR